MARPCIVACADGAADAMVRLDKLLAERGAGSRKDVDRMIRKGLVELDGELVGKSGAKLKVPWSSAPIVDGFDYPPPPLLAAYHKPLGVVSTMRDDRNRPDLSSVLPLSWQKLLHPVGRLDADTTGLLLFSRDGDLTHRLLHPKFVVEREYVAEVENEVDEARLAEQLRRGVETTEDGESLVVQATLLEASGQSVRLVVTEGKYRMVRRVLANCGHPVTALHRVRYGAIELRDDELAEGEAKELEPHELDWVLGLRAAAAAQQPKAAAAAAAAADSAAAAGVDDDGSDDGDGGGGTPVAASQPRVRRQRRRDGGADGPRDAAGGIDADQAMEEAIAAAWVPRRADVQLVLDQCPGATEEEATEALRRHRDDGMAIVKAITDLM